MTSDHRRRQGRGAHGLVLRLVVGETFPIRRDTVLRDLRPEHATYPTSPCVDDEDVKYEMV
jgi:hypothetical protein